MKRIKEFTLVIATFLFVSTFSACDMYSYVTPSVQSTYENPQWAPPYYEGVRYYYLPDIESYYDLNSREFVYLSNGQWYYSSICPSNYAGFDLNNSFTIALDRSIYQPWMHHQYYVSHYPRYYYRDYYDHSNIPYVRGFNENNKSAIYWKENERNRARNWDDEGLKTNRKFKYTKEDREKQTNWNNSTPSRSSGNDNVNRQRPNNMDNNAVTPPRSGNDNVNRQRPNNRDNNAVTPPRSGNDNTNRQQPNNRDNNTVTPPRSGNDNTNRQQPNNRDNNAVNPPRSGNDNMSRPQLETSPRSGNTNYYGRPIGQPVKVEKQMRQQTKAESRGNTETNSNEKDKDNSRR